MDPGQAEGTNPPRQQQREILRGPWGQIEMSETGELLPSFIFKWTLVFYLYYLLFVLNKKTSSFREASVVRSKTNCNFLSFSYTDTDPHVDHMVLIIGEEVNLIVCMETVRAWVERTDLQKSKKFSKLIMKEY